MLKLRVEFSFHLFTLVLADLITYLVNIFQGNASLLVTSQDKLFFSGGCPRYLAMFDLGQLHSRVAKGKPRSPVN